MQLPFLVQKLTADLLVGEKSQSLGSSPPLFSMHLSAAAMNPQKLSESPKAAVTAWKNESPTVVAGTTIARTMPKVRELSQLIADIRRARAALDAAGLTDEPVRLEHVISDDPRD